MARAVRPQWALAGAAVVALAAAACTTSPTTATTTSLTSDSPNNTSGLGQLVTFTAKVAAKSQGFGPPTGTVQFTDSGAALGCTGGSPTLDTNATATCTTSTLTLGPHTITAAYGGGGHFASSSGTLTQNVNQQAP
jgi:hypothetical protein